MTRTTICPKIALVCKLGLLGFLGVCGFSAQSTAQEKQAVVRRAAVDEETVPRASEATADEDAINRPEFQLTPEFRELAPYQPLYVRLSLKNPTDSPAVVSRELYAMGVQFVVQEEGQPRNIVERSNELFFEQITVPPRSEIVRYHVLGADYSRRDQRRAPLRIFDLPGHYSVLGHSGEGNDLEVRDHITNSVNIVVRKPTEDESLAGKFLKDEPFGPPNYSLKRSRPELESEVKQLRDFLAKYPRSVFADDLKLLLGQRLMQLGYQLTETGPVENDELRAEGIRIWMSVDVKRAWVRRTMLNKSLMNYLCRPEIQALVNVRGILTQWKANPPHPKDDLPSQEFLKEWIPKIEESLRNNPQPEKVTATD